MAGKTSIARVLGSIAMVLILWVSWVTPSLAQTYAAEIANVVEAIENLDLLRQGLASSLELRTEPPTHDTFKQVCKPVGMQAKQLSQENGWQVKQVATRYRNPAHAPQTDTEHMALALLEQNPDLMGFWQNMVIADQPGLHYFRRIAVMPACLACHGRKESRPDFVRETYPEDRAYGFDIGDLRGMYAVFVPSKMDAPDSVADQQARTGT